jgi:hypothetical protein
LDDRGRFVAKRCGLGVIALLDSRIARWSFRRSPSLKPNSLMSASVIHVTVPQLSKPFSVRGLLVLVESKLSEHCMQLECITRTLRRSIEVHNELALGVICKLKY